MAQRKNEPVRTKLEEVNESLTSTAQKLEENFNALVEAINKAKPASSKGQYIKSCVIASTMGPGIKINYSKLG